jgi:hypothetical protein
MCFEVNLFEHVYINALNHTAQREEEEEEEEEEMEALKSIIKKTDDISGSK